MVKRMLLLATVSGAALGAWIGIAAAAPTKAAGEAPGHSHEKCELHGGQVTMTKQHHFETVFAPDGVRVFIYSAEQTPLPVGKAVGTVTLEYKDGTTRQVPLAAEKPAEGQPAVYYCSMHPAQTQMAPGKCAICGMNLIPQYSLAAKADLSKVPPGTLKAVVRLAGLEGTEPEATFTETYTGAPAAKPVKPVKPVEPTTPAKS